MRVIEFECLDNVRDLGHIPVAEGRRVKSGLIFRGPALYKASDTDLAKLEHELQVRCVVDLRCGWERESRPNPVFGDTDYLSIPFYDLAVVGIDYTHPAPGTITIGHDFACDPDHFYRSLANEKTVHQMRLALHEILHRAIRGQSVYQHCSGGKDRTGIMTLLILECLGAHFEDILEDYLMTNESRDKDYESTFRRFLRLADGDPELAHELVLSHRARPENLRVFYEAVQEKYGSMDEFLENQLGFNLQAREHARDVLTEKV